MGCGGLRTRVLMRRFWWIGLVIWCGMAEAKMQRTLWYPDTCHGCSMEYEWDDSVPQEQRIHTPVQIDDPEGEFKGSENMGLQIMEENQRKNVAIGEILKENPTLIDASGALLPTIVIDFTYDQDRILHLSVSGLKTIQEKSDAQIAVDAKLGENKVVVE